MKSIYLHSFAKLDDLLGKFELDSFVSAIIKSTDILQKLLCIVKQKEF